MVASGTEKKSWAELRHKHTSFRSCLVFQLISCNGPDISRVAGVAEVTIRNSYKDLYPHAAKLIPDWFLKEVNLKNLPAP